MAVPEPNERALHERLLARDARALGIVYDASSPAVFAVALRVTGDRGSAQDITQVVFLDLWLRPERFEPDRGPLRPWLATIAHHAGVDWVRREAKLKDRERRYAQIPSETLPDLADTVEAVLDSESVRLALDGLPDQQSTPIRLAFFNGKSYRRVAEELGVPEGTVKARIRTGLRRIGETIRSEDEEWVTTGAGLNRTAGA